MKTEVSFFWVNCSFNIVINFALDNYISVKGNGIYSICVYIRVRCLPQHLINLCDQNFPKIL